MSLHFTLLSNRDITGGQETLYESLFTSAFLRFRGHISGRKLLGQYLESVESCHLSCSVPGTCRQVHAGEANQPKYPALPEGWAGLPRSVQCEGDHRIYVEAVQLQSDSRIHRQICTIVLVPFALGTVYCPELRLANLGH